MAVRTPAGPRAPQYAHQFPRWPLLPMTLNTSHMLTSPSFAPPAQTCPRNSDTPTAQPLAQHPERVRASQMDTLPKTHLLSPTPQRGCHPRLSPLVNSSITGTAAQDTAPRHPWLAPSLTPTAHQLHLETEPEGGPFAPPLPQLPWIKPPNSWAAKSYLSHVSTLPSLTYKTPCHLAPASSCRLSSFWSPLLIPPATASFLWVSKHSRLRPSFALAALLPGTAFLCRLCCLTLSYICFQITCFLRKPP